MEVVHNEFQLILFCLSCPDDENCVSVWSFSYSSSMVDNSASIGGGDLNGQPENENI